MQLGLLVVPGHVQSTKTATLQNRVVLRYSVSLFMSMHVMALHLSHFSAKTCDHLIVIVNIAGIAKNRPVSETSQTCP